MAKEALKVARPTTSTDRWKVLGFRPPSGDAVEPAEPILLEYDSGGQVAILTLNRPHAGNGITTEMGKRMVEILRELAARPTVRCIIITGAGNEAFSIGSDLHQRNNMTNEQWTQQHNLFDITQYFVRQLRKPIFAAVNGMTWAGAFELVMSCDFIIASENATFGQWESMVGLSAGAGGPVFLPRILPPGKALQMLMTGESITAREAYRLGMVNELYPRGELMPAARRIAQRIAINSPTAVQAVKRATRMGMGLPIEVELIDLSFNASYTHLYVPSMRRHIQLALKAGATMEEIMEVLKLCVVQGVQACNLGVPILAEELAMR